MSIASAWSIALVGMEGTLVEVEAAISSGLPRTVLVGLPDAALHEARDRCRAALTAVGLGWPNELLTINLTPASLPKAGQVVSRQGFATTSEFGFGRQLGADSCFGFAHAKSLAKMWHLKNLSTGQLDLTKTCGQFSTIRLQPLPPPVWPRPPGVPAILTPTRLPPPESPTDQAFAAN